MFYIIVILAGIFAMPASAQSLKEQLVGTWGLTSCNLPDFLPCVGNNGILVYDASGHYTWTMAARGRPKAPDLPGEVGRNRSAYALEQYKAMASGLFAQFGTWSVNEASKTVTLHIEGALFPNIEGTEFGPFTPVISGDELSLNGTINRQFVWRRISK